MSAATDASKSTGSGRHVNGESEVVAAHRSLPFSALAVTCPLGVLMVAVADAGTRSGTAVTYSWAYWLFWAGVVCVFAPVAVTLCARNASARAGLTAVLVTALGLYLIKVIYSPTQVAFSDEFAHWRNAQNILASGHLFHHDPLIPIAAHYPGLAIATNALVHLAGFSITTAEFVLICVARLIITVSIFWIIQSLTGRPRVAMLGSLLYMAHPNYFYFDAQAAYESFALPLAALALAVTVEASRVPTGRRWGLQGVACLLILSVVVTHHVTAYALAGVLSCWMMISVVLRRRGGSAKVMIPWLPAVIAVSATTVWAVLAAPATVGYLGPVFSRALTQTIDVALGSGHTRALYTSSSGLTAPTWERVSGLIGILLLLALLAVGLRSSRWLRRAHPLAPVAIAAAAAYPIILALRLVPSAQETANRASAYVFVGIALVAGVAAARFASSERRLTRTLIPGVLVMIFIGGITSAWAFYQRMPSISSSVPLAPTSENLAAASWMLHFEGSNNVVAADKTDRAAFGSFGEQNPVFGANGNVPVWAVFLPLRVNDIVLRTLTKASIKFVVVDRRLSSGPPPELGYFDQGEPLVYGARHPLPGRALRKFDTSPRFERIYDNGSIQIFEVLSPAHVLTLFGASHRHTPRRATIPIGRRICATKRSRGGRGRVRVCQS